MSHLKIYKLYKSAKNLFIKCLRFQTSGNKNTTV